MLGRGLPDAPRIRSFAFIALSPDKMLRVMQATIMRTLTNQAILNCSDAQETGLVTRIHLEIPGTSSS